jgi:SPP1 gp7 family putative phage head morphogenesis protein
MDARKSLAALTIVSMASFADAASEELLVSDLLGRLQVRQEIGELAMAEATWASLPPEEAISWFKSLRIVTPDVMGQLEAAYRNKGFSVAGLYQDYALERTHELIGKALEEGTTKREFLRELNKSFDNWGLTRLGKFHAETVFDTNVGAAYAHGRWQQMRDPAVMRARPFWQYHTAGDHRVRPTHQAMNGRVFPADHPIWKTWYPPNGFRCRCSVNSVSQREVERDGLEVSETLPQAVEVGTQVYQMIPDQGFAGSPEGWLEAA